MSNNPRHILIVLMGSLGDLARALSIVDPLKMTFSDATLTWLVDDRWADFVRLHPAIDRVLVFERRRGIAGVRKVIGELRALKPDLTLDMQRHFKSGVCSWLSGASRRVGFHPRDCKEFNYLFNTEFVPRYGEIQPKINQYWSFLTQLSVSVPDEPSFGLERINVTELVKDKLPQAGFHFAGIILGSSWKSKDWFLEGYAKLIDFILQRTPHGVVLLGDKSQTERAARLSDGKGKERIVNLVAQTTLPELVGILKLAQYAVGPDSGPGHISAAVGTPYVSLFGPTLPNRVAPFGLHHLVVRSAIGCSPCGRRECPGLGTLCMRLISPDAVWEKIQQL